MTDVNKVKPQIHNINDPGHGMPGFVKRTTSVPVKEITNTKGNMDVLDLYTRGKLKPENIGDVCANCVNFYRDPQLDKTKHGRCKARGFRVMHEDTAADERRSYNNPDGGYFPTWPACPWYVDNTRNSRK